MKKNFRKIFMLMAVVVTAMVCFAVSASAASLASTGKCGDNVYWKYNSTNKRLTISGSGEMWDSNSSVDSPFYDSNINTVVIEDGVTTIRNGAFLDSELISVTIGKDVSDIGEYAFLYCFNLKSITVSEKNPYYSNDKYGVLFDKTKSKLIQYTTGNTRTSYSIPDGVNSIGDCAFNSSNLNNVIIPNSVTRLEGASFNNCDGLSNIIIPDSVTFIEGSVFAGCDNLVKAQLPNNITSIPLSMFGYCYNLKSVNIPVSVISIGYEAFHSCKLEDVYYSGSEEEWKNIKIYDRNDSLKQANIHYNANTIPDENALFTLHAFASHPRLILGYGGAIDMVFELECYNANIGSSFLVSNPTFTFTSSNPDIFEIAEISNNGKNTSIRLYENGKGGKAHLIVSAYVDGKFKAARQFEVTTSGELVYDMDTILRAAAGELEGSLATELYWHNMQVDNFKYVETGDECNLSFDVYNMVNFIGAVEVYDKDGNLIENRYVDPFEGNMPTGLWDAGKYLYDIATLDFKDNDYKSELRSKKTSVSLYGVPLDGRVVFTSDIDSSAVCAAYNIADIIMKTCLEAISVVDTSKSVTKKATEKLVEELLEAVSLKENAKNTFNKILDRYFKVADLGDESSMIKSMKDFLNFISSMDIDIGEIVLETLKESGITVVERLVTYTLGTIGKVTDVVFKFVSVSNIIEHAQNVSAFRGSRDTSLYFRKYASYKLTSNGYHVSNDDAFSEEITFHQFKIMSGDKLYQALDEFADVEYLDVVSMAIYKNGKEVQPGGEVQVAIPLPEGMSFLNVRVYRQESDGTFTKLDCDFSDVRDGYIYITTDHFSVYCIAGEKIKETAMHFEQQNYTIYTGESVMPKPVLTPANAYMPEIKAVSSNTRVATVTDDGMVKGVSQGTASITVTSENGTSAKFNVTVLSNPNAIPGRASKTASVQNTSTIKLAWDAVPGAAGYRVYQRVGNNWKALGNTSKTTATINKLKAGTKYSFAVIAGAVDSGKVIWSDVYTVINTATKTVTPAKVASAQNTSALKLAWSACPGATGYRIFYKSGNTWKVALSTTSATSHLFSGLKAGTKYTFAVRPYIINSGNVIWSDYVQFTAATKSAAPMVKSSSTDSSITLYWDAVSADGYRIYYRTASSDWKIAVNSLTDTHHTFAGLKSGSSYIFAVRPYVKTTLGVVWGEYKAVAAGVNKTNIQKIDINVSEMYIDTDGVLSVLIDTSDWDGELVPNSQYVSCRMDYEESDVPLLLTLTDEVDSDGYQRLTADFGEDNEYFDYYYISFTIPEGFIRNKSGTQYNNSLGLIW